MESTPTKIWPIFVQLGGQKGQTMVNETAKHFSNGKVVFDHGPKVSFGWHGSINGKSQNL